MNHNESYKVLVSKIIEIAEIQGFTVYHEKKGSETEFSFSQFTERGQDFSFSISMDNQDFVTFLTELSDYYEGYDPEAEIMLWLDNDGHGKNGAPFHMRDVLSDMEDCEKMIGQLFDALQSAYLNNEIA